MTACQSSSEVRTVTLPVPNLTDVICRPRSMINFDRPEQSAHKSGDASGLLVFGSVDTLSQCDEAIIVRGDGGVVAYAVSNVNGVKDN
jgi:hypothetical protein